MNDQHPKQVPGVATTEYDTRKAFLQLTQQDAVALAELGKRLINLKTFFVERFYDHLLEFDEPRSMLSDPAGSPISSRCRPSTSPSSSRAITAPPTAKTDSASAWSTSASASTRIWRRF